MSSKTEEKADSNVSRFELDGVVAEMVIEVEENDPSSSAEANSADKSEETPLKEGTDGLEEKESTVIRENDAVEDEKEEKETIESENNEEEESESSNEVPDQAKKSRGRPKINPVLKSGDQRKDAMEEDEKEEKETIESEPNEEKESESSNEVPDQAKRSRGRPKKNPVLKSGDRRKDATEEDEKKMEDIIETEDNEEKDSESSNEVPDQSKKSRGRPKKNPVMISETKQSKADSNEKSEVDSESRRTRTSILKSKPSVPEVTSSLKRGNKSTSSSQEEDNEVPEKKLRSSSKDNTPKKSKRSVFFSPDTKKADLTKIQSGTKPVLKGTPSTSKTTPKSDKAARTYSKGRPVSVQSMPTSDKATPSFDKRIPALAVRDSKLKAWNLNPLGISNLDSFPLIKEKVQRAELKFIKSLHQVLYNRVLSKDVQGKDLRREILEFQGFSFKKNSAEYRKHKNIFETMPDSTISKISNILKMKDKNVSNIMEFLLQPSKIIYCEVDPLHPSMQPVLKLQKISLENPSSNVSSDDESNSETFSSEDTLVTSKRKRFPSTKLRFYESDFEVPASKKKSQETERSNSKPLKVKKEPLSSSTTQLSSSTTKKVPLQAQNAKKASVQTAKQTVIKSKKTEVKMPQLKMPQLKMPQISVDRKMKIVKRPMSNDLNVRRKALDLAIEIQETVDLADLEEGNESDNNEESSLESFEYEAEIKQEVVTDDECEDNAKLKKSENSSEGTLSADEAKGETPGETQKKKRFYKTPAIPLKTFPTIRENILKADFAALQRLHIVLFGSSDKASNLRGNILSFGGFPFYKGSEDWKQKEFLLSLLSQTTLKEYLDILDVKYRDGNQRLLIKRLMNFLVAPIEKLPDIEDDDNEGGSDMEVVTTDQLVPVECPPVLLNRPAPSRPAPSRFAPPVKVMKKKPVKKPIEKKPPRMRKVLMDEAQVRRLEADLAREQRILEREKKLHEGQLKKLYPSSTNKTIKATFNLAKNTLAKAVTETHADTELLNALMETVYQRRELKKAGAKVSVPNKGGHIRLGELANVKFLVVTANYNDLDVLHHLIYMTEAVKGRVRKNILDFAGFNFTEESPAYQDRMNFLKSLGYDISRRLAFLLGLCPFKTLIAQQDLNELIMYFLMSPCQSKQVPIRDLPTTFFANEMPVELSALVEKHSGDLTNTPVEGSAANASQQPTVSANQPSQSEASPGPRAKKSFHSSFASSKMMNLQPSISTLPLKAPEKLLKSSFTPQKQNQVIKTLSPPTGPAQEIFIQQQTPDGQQKTFKLVKLPANHPLMTSLKNQTQQSAPTTSHPQPITINPPVIGAPGLPPGLIVFKNNPTNPALSSIMQTVPLGIGQPAVTPVVVPKMTQLVMPKLDNKSSVVLDTERETEDVLPKEKDSDVSVECDYGADDAEELCPLEGDGPPTDEDIYGTIQDIIHGCPSLEDITLRNVISRVSAKYPNYDLTPQHYFMKECVKKIIMGT